MDRIYRGELFYLVASPNDREDAYRFFEDGGLVVAQGKVVEAGPFKAMRGRYPALEVTDYSGHLIMPGLIDSHIHFAQSEMVGMYGKQLLDWLDEYTFPTEIAFSSEEYARRIARFFVQELLKNGTTSCVAFATVHPASVEALFSEAASHNMRILAGKVLMDRNAPRELTDTPDSSEEDSCRLIEKWHGKGRSHYVVTPRFAITSSPNQLIRAGRLLKKYPSVYVQTHLSENRGEIESVKHLFPTCEGYLDVYERAGLLTDRSLFGHCVHLTDKECHRLAESGGIAVHCPTSNLFLGSGLFSMERANQYGIRTLLATDVGAGTSFSMWRTMGEAYKVQQLSGYSMSVFEAIDKCTRGAAQALSLDDRIGSFLPGREADFIVVDYASTPAQSLRRDYLRARGKWTLTNRLFGLQTLADDRNTIATYLMGNQVYSRDL